LVPVHQVTDLTARGAHVERELALVKVAGSGDHRIEALRLAEVYRARVVDATIASFVFEVTGTIEKIDKFVELMGEVGLVEVARTGIVAIARGAEAA
jgi:acetolactate synthase-1/3 small subunit